MPYNNDKWLQEMLEEFKKDKWSLVKWYKKPGLVERSSGSITFYDGQEYDKDKYDLVEDAWSHDHCEICGKTISDYVSEREKDPVIDEAYTNGYDWLCIECYKKYLLIN